MKRISAAAAGFAIAAGMLLPAVTAHADEPDPATPTSAGADARPLHHPLALHYLHGEPHTTPHGLSHSVRQAHRPGG